MIFLKSSIILENAMMKEMMAEVDRFTGAQVISKKEGTRIRLLVEEALSILKATLKQGHGELKIKPMDGEYIISAVVDSFYISEQAKERLVEVATNSKNEYYKGFTGKIRQAIEFLASSSHYAYMSNGVQMPIGYIVDGECGPLWSYQNFKQNLDNDNAEDYDELERSILSKLSREILVGVSDSTVTLKIFYQVSK